MNSPEKMPEEKPSAQEKPVPWEITYDKKGKIVGLPTGVFEKDIIVFIGNDKKHYAQLPTPELIKERKMWRSDERD